MSYKHFTSSADGSLATVDAHNGKILWQRDFGSVIANMYILKHDGMHKLQSIAIGKETFDSLIKVKNFNFFKFITIYLMYPAKSI